MFFLAQALAIISFLLGATAYQRKNRKNILSLWAWSAFFNTLHFLALGSLESALFAAATAIRFLVASRTSSKIALLIIILLILSLFIFVPRDDVGIMAFLAATVGAIGAFQSNPNAVRLLLFASTSLWAVNNYLVGSPIGFFMEVVFLVSNFWGYHNSKK
ncbi:MAG: YgjV family protein [Pseudomonadota bacterium]